MKTEIKKLKDNSIEMRVDIAPEKFREAVGAAYKQVAKKVSIPGFRKGKIPATVIDQRIGKGAVYEEAIRSNIGDYYSQALKDSGVEPIDQPDIEITAVDEEKGLSFKAKVDVVPEVKLGNYKGIKVKKPEIKVSEADINKQIEALRDKFASVEPVKGKPAEMGDYVLINFDGTIGGKPFEGGSAKDFLLQLGSNTFIPEFESALAGSKSGEIRSINVKIPGESTNKEIAGKDAVFKVLIKEVKVKKLPEMTDEFIKKQLPEFKSLKDLKNEIKTDLNEQSQKTAEQQYRTEVLNAAAEKADVDIPEKMIEDEINRLVADFEYGLKMRGADLESYLKTTQTDEKDFRKNFAEEAQKRVKSNLVMEAIADKENIIPSEMEIKAEIKQLHEASQKQKQTDKSFSDFKKGLEDKGLIEYLDSSIKYRKVLDFLEKQAQSNVNK